jgi:hypothetical protein
MGGMESSRIVRGPAAVAYVLLVVLWVGTAVASVIAWPMPRDVLVATLGGLVAVSGALHIQAGPATWAVVHPDLIEIRNRFELIDVPRHLVDGAVVLGVLGVHLRLVGGDRIPVDLGGSAHRRRIELAESIGTVPEIASGGSVQRSFRVSSALITVVASLGAVVALWALCAGGRFHP